MAQSNLEETLSQMEAIKARVEAFIVQIKEELAEVEKKEGLVVLKDLKRGDFFATVKHPSGAVYIVTKCNFQLAGICATATNGNIGHFDKQQKVFRKTKQDFVTKLLQSE